MLDQIIKQTRDKMEQVLAQMSQDFSQLRTGKASAVLVESIIVDQYGAKLPIKQLATITVPDVNLIVITPWDKGSLVQIEAAIDQSNLGLNSVNDGSSIRLNLPPMSAERRAQIARLVLTRAEEARVALRELRQSAWSQVQKNEKLGQLTQDDRYRGEEMLNKLIAEFNDEVKKSAQSKEQEISSV